jgi:hypothetical protein
MKRRRFKTPEEEDEALRNDPLFKALVEDLKRQTPEQLERLGEWLNEQAEREETDANHEGEEISEESEG